MATKPAPRGPRDAYGLEHHQLVAGSFYQCIQVGGFTDRATGIHIPGPKAILDDSTKREVIELTEIPEPVQIPHFKIVVEISDSGKTKKEVERDFTAIDDMPVCEAFHLALSTGIIRRVPDHVMEEKYPETWASRKEHYVWRDSGMQTQKSMRDLFDQAEDDQKFARLTEAAEKAQSVRAKIAEREREIDEPRKVSPPPAKRGVKPPPPPTA